MRLLLISGSHSRHLYVMQQLLQVDNPVGVIVMQREATVPDAPLTINQTDEAIFKQHFDIRQAVEDREYGKLLHEGVFQNFPILERSSENLNSSETAQFIQKCNPTACIIFGSDLINGEVLKSLPPFTLNFHLGLSPWYRGSATLFWPFYFMEPQFAGSTIHKIVLEADAGVVLQQTVPKLSTEMGIHDVGAATVKAGCKDLVTALELFKNDQNMTFSEQKTSGRLFLTKDFLPHHLRVNYNLFGDKMTKAFLDGSLGKKMPRLIQNI